MGRSIVGRMLVNSCSPMCARCMKSSIEHERANIRCFFKGANKKDDSDWMLQIMKMNTKIDCDKHLKQKCERQ